MTRARVRRCAVFAAAALCLVLAGCRPSPFVAVTVTNASGDNIHQFELDYPGASMGRDTLASGETYATKVQFRGSANAKASFTDSSGKQHESTGPALKEGERGALDIRIAPGNDVSWNANVGQPSR